MMTKEERDDIEVRYLRALFARDNAIYLERMAARDGIVSNSQIKRGDDNPQTAQRSLNIFEDEHTVMR